VNFKVSAGSPAQPRDRKVAKATWTLLADELPRVRTAALAWRNGLGALLAGLIGFGLLKGRSDVTQLQPGIAALVGILLLVALISGSIAAALVMRAAHGRPYAVSLRRVLSGTYDDPTLGGQLDEADASQRALRRGVLLSFLCVALLTAAVAVTWYGPVKDKPSIEVRLTNGATECGEVVSVAMGQLVLKTARGQISVDLTQTNGLAAVDSCAMPVKP
jgi:hypothetical protein